MFRTTQNSNSKRRSSHRISSRSGAAVVEFAVLLPVMVVLVFGAIEMANGIFLKQAVSVAAYEGARAAARPTGSVADVNSRVNEVLSARRISNPTISVSPSLTGITRGSEITVTVSVSSANLGNVLPLRFLNNKNFSRTIVMVRQ